MVAASCLLSLLLAAPQGDPSTAASTTAGTAALCREFSGFDQDGDGAVELARVEPLFEAGERGGRVVVLVEERLLRPAHLLPDLRPRLSRLVDDLAAEGHRAVALRVTLGTSEEHQDGRYVLALRELLRGFARDGELRCALLVGHFPDALLVRTCNWRRKGDITLRKGRPDQAVHRGVRYLRRVPEDVAHRADIVLADLDGNWERVYVQPRTRVEAIVSVFDGAIPAAGGSCVDAERSARVYEDFFHVQDGSCELLRQFGPDGTPPWFVTLDDRAGGFECSDDDRTRTGNVIARPDILVSRLDARGTAMAPDPKVVGRDVADHLLDFHGQPRQVEFEGRDVPDWRRIWWHDERIERRLLNEYLDRNHAYRTGEAQIAWRPSSLACELRSGFRELAKAADDWLPAVAGRSDVHGRPGLGAVVDWLAFPAVLRTLRAHSDPWGSVFRKGNVDAFAARLQGPAWSWTRVGNRLEPSLRAACSGGKFDWHLLHTLWRNGAVAAEPSFYHHTGCHGISPPGALKLAYDHPAYGRMQGGEALLLFGNGLALVGRAKVFYDEPRGFSAVLHDGGTFGDAWARYFEVESRAAAWREVGGDIGRKRAYFWSVLGDATLRLERGQRR